MARLPSDRYLIQQIGDEVVLFEQYTEREIARFNPGDAQSAQEAAGVTIAGCEEMDVKDRVMAGFWAGYFYAHGV